MGRNNRYRSYKKNRRKERPDTAAPAAQPAAKKGEGEVSNGIFVYSGAISLDTLAKKLGLQASVIMKELFLAGKMLTINSVLDDELIAEICLSHNFDFRREEVIAKEDFEKIGLEIDEAKATERPPVVTIMGHVNHGKTTLIDAIRGSSIVTGEAGSITQSIGAYQKTVNDKKITFLDTPGHEAFTAMRARGASLTDIAVIVVAADDGVMPQTREAIDHAKAAGVSIIIAINKIDRPGANPERVKNELSGFGLTPEEWGGDTIMVEISAKQKQNLEKLMETIIFVAEMKELRADPTARAFGSVIEATLDRQEGAKSTFLVQNGTLKVGDHLVVGNSYCKVRRMTNEFGKPLKEAGPSTPVVVTGLSEVPTAGERFIAFESEKEAKQVAQKRMLTAISRNSVKRDPLTLESLFAKLGDGTVPHIAVILKADSQGSVEAIKASLDKISIEGASLSIVRAAAGEITEGDVILAEASNAVILGFTTKANQLAIAKAKEAGIEMRFYTVIYRLLDDMEMAMKGLLKPIMREVVYGRATVTNLFKSSAVGTIAGAMVNEGKIKSRSHARLYRNEELIADTTIASLKRFKDDVKEVGTGFDCGIVLSDAKEIQIDDVIESYGSEEVKNG